MKTITSIIALLLVTGMFAQADMKIMSIQGDVKVRHGAEEGWVSVAAGDVVKPEDSMRSGRGSTAVLLVDGATRLTLPELVIVDCSDLRTLTQEELLLKLAMEGIRSLPQQKRDGDMSIPRTTTVHGSRTEASSPLQPGSKDGFILQLNGTKVLHENGFYATMVLRAKEVFRLSPTLRSRYDVRLLVADAFEKMQLNGEALGEYNSLSKEKLSLRDRAVVERRIAVLKKTQD